MSEETQEWPESPGEEMPSAAERGLRLSALGGRVGRWREPFEPRWLREGPPPAWWLEQERQRLYSLYPDLCPDGTDPLPHYLLGGRERTRWYDAPELVHGISATAIAYILFEGLFWMTGRHLLLLPLLALVPAYAFVLLASYLAQLARARSVGLMQQLVLASRSPSDILSVVFQDSVDRSKGFLRLGLIAGGTLVAIRIGILTGFTGSRFVFLMLRAAIYMAVAGYLGTVITRDGGSFRTLLVAVGFHLSHLARHMPPIFAAGVGTSLVIVACGAVLSVPLLLMEIVHQLTASAGLAVVFELIGSIVAFLILVEVITRYRTRKLHRSRILEDVGTYP